LERRRLIKGAVKELAQGAAAIATLVAAAHAGPAPVAAALEGVAGNLFTYLLVGTWAGAQRLGVKSKPTQLERTLKGAFVDAVQSLHKSYCETDHYRDSMDQGFVDSVFGDLETEGARLFTEPVSSSNASMLQGLSLNASGGAEAAMAQILSRWLEHSDIHISTFIERNLIQAVTSRVDLELHKNESAREELQFLTVQATAANVSEIRNLSTPLRQLGSVN
jgi:hypothetical protein